jgi:hypothetical protein
MATFVWSAVVDVDVRTVVEAGFEADALDVVVGEDRGDLGLMS